jgi:hypothetical protein
MLERSAINTRLREMRVQADAAGRWDENCEGSARALVVFVGPSPGYNPKDPPTRRPLRRNYHPALWNAGYARPLGWAGGFKIGFQPLVEALLSRPYAKASKLIARANLDWFGNPNAPEVPEKFMYKGAPSVLRMIEDCSPELILAMEKRAFDVLNDVFEKGGFIISECEVKNFQVRISDAANSRAHPYLRCFRAISPNGRELVVIKLPQHPVRILQSDYGTRCGRAVRIAARQIAAGRAVDVTMT